MTPETPLDRTMLLELLDEVADEAEARGVRVELFLVGGAAMSLAYDSERSTADLDAVFVPTDEVRAIAEAVAAHHPELGLAPTWLDDGVKGSSRETTPTHWSSTTVRTCRCRSPLRATCSS